MPDEAARRYLFVAIDRATRWVFLRVYPDQSEANSLDFLERLHEAAPMMITKALTDNGSQFADASRARREVVQQTRFGSGAELDATLTAHCKTNNHHIPQRSLDHRSPVQAPQAWQVSEPHLFKRAVYKHASLDNYMVKTTSWPVAKFYLNSYLPSQSTLSLDF